MADTRSIEKNVQPFHLFSDKQAKSSEHPIRQASIANGELVLFLLKIAKAQ